MPTSPHQRQREGLGHARRPSQAYRHTVTPLAKYLQLAQTLGFWAALLFVLLYVLDVDTSISTSTAELKKPLKIRQPQAPLPGVRDSEKLLPDVEKPVQDISPVASFGAAVQTYSCFGKPCPAEEYEYIVTTFSGLNKSPLYQGLDITRVKQAPANTMIESCVPPSRLLSNGEDIPDVGALPWLTNVHQYLAHESELCVVALRHDLSEGTFVGRLEPPTYLGDRVCQTFLASNDKRERLEGWRCMDSDTTYSIVDVSDNDSNIEKNSNLDLGSSRNPSVSETAAEGNANHSDEEEVSHNRSLQDLDEVVYHAPLLAGIRNAFISPVGHVFSALHALVPNGYCQPERLRYARPALSKRSDGRVFVISQPRDTSDPYTTLIDALPRLATHYGELTSAGGKDIMIHHNGGAVMEQILGLLDFPKRRLVTGDNQFNLVYVPEPSPRCGGVSVYQTSLLRDILRARLIESAPGLRRKPAQGIVLIVQGGPDPSSDPRIANTDALASQLRELYPNEKVIVLRSNPGKEPRSAKDTLALFHLAKLVIAPRGPRLSFLLASARGTAVIEVVADKSFRANAHPEDPSATPGRRYADLARALDLQAYVMAGKVTNASPSAADVSKGNIVSEGLVESGIVVDIDKVKAVLFEVSESQGRKPWNKHV